MAASYMNLGQLAPAATTESAFPTVAAATQWVVSSLVVCNRSSTATTFRISVSVGGGATANTDYLYYDVAIAGNDTLVATLGLTLTTGDIVRVYAGTANLTFSLWGTKIT